MKSIKILGLVLAATAFVSCASEPSLQEYYVENQQDNKFIAVDVPTSMLPQSSLYLNHGACKQDDAHKQSVANATNKYNQ